MDISIIIPAYNEDKNVAELYKKISAVLRTLKKSYEIIFIDDGSTDDTYSELQKLNKLYNKVRIIIDESDENGPFLNATFEGLRTQLSDKHLVKMFFLYPLMNRIF